MKFEQIPIHVIGRRGAGQGTIRSFEHAKPDESVKDSLLLREVGPSEIVLSGWQRTWLGVPVEAQVTREIANVRNVVQDGTSLRFEIRRKYRPVSRVSMSPYLSCLDQAVR
jgi:hypothetical protein